MKMGSNSLVTRDFLEIGAALGLGALFDDAVVQVTYVQEIQIKAGRIHITQRVLATIKPFVFFTGFRVNAIEQCLFRWVVL